MSRTVLRALTVAVFGALALAVDARAQEPSWRLEQPDPPAGFEFRTPLGAPGDLQFFENRRNRGLLGIEGNASIARGLYLFDGERWRQLSTVCGGPADGMRIAWAGPTEWWTISEPSAPRRGATITLCRFKDGQVLASYGTRDNASDPYRPMNAATCNGPDDCWFGGPGTQDPTGARKGAFHLHWDGARLETVYNPQGRGVSDLEAHAGTVFESVFVGRGPEDDAPAELTRPETPRPRLLHRIVERSFRNDDFVPERRADEPADGAELLALDGDGAQLWTAGGGAGSGPSAPPGGVVPRGPLAARLVGGAFQERSLVTAPGEAFDGADRFSDVAAVPGTDDAWVAVQPFADRRNERADALVARIDGATGAVEQDQLPASGAGRGSAARIAFTAPNDGWLVTYAGWLFHYTDGSRAPRDDEPAFRDLISFRPDEGAEQFIPDTPPVDDNRTFQAPPVEIAPPATTETVTQGTPLRALLGNFKVRVRRRPLAVVLTFTLRRRARVGLVGLRRGKTVARARTRALKPGRRRLVLRVSRNRYPTRLKFVTRELELPAGAEEGTGSEDAVTTGPPATGDTTTTGTPAGGDTITAGGAARGARSRR